jgi:predicted transglutaminase-like protease
MVQVAQFTVLQTCEKQTEQPVLFVCTYDHCICLNIQNWPCLAVDQFLKTTEICQILIKCNFGGMSKLLHKTKRELSQPITTALLLQANTLTLILNEQISKSIVLIRQGRELHN